MKYVKKYERWTSDVSDDVEINYGSEITPKYSDIVIYTINYLNDNFDKIRHISQDNIEFSNGGIEKIRLYDDEIQFVSNSFNDRGNGRSFRLTKDESDYLSKFKAGLSLRYARTSEKEYEDEVLNKIDPVRKSANKYNL